MRRLYCGRLLLASATSHCPHVTPRLGFATFRPDRGTTWSASDHRVLRRMDKGHRIASQQRFNQRRGSSELLKDTVQSHHMVARHGRAVSNRLQSTGHGIAQSSQRYPAALAVARDLLQQGTEMKHEMRRLRKDIGWEYIRRRRQQ